MPRVSVITPAYNAECFLEETVKSVQMQTFTDWEMIIVDDCSKDGTYELATRLSQEDSRLRVLKNPHNSGVAAILDALESSISSCTIFGSIPNKVSTFSDVGRGIKSINLIISCNTE